MIKPVVKNNVADEVFRQMFDLLMNKRWAEGEKLPSENELKDLFGVSRNTVRSALDKLGLMGIVETRQGEGNFVRKIGVGLYMNTLVPYIFLNRDDIFTIMDFRKGIEIQAARLAAKRASAEDIEGIRRSLDFCRKNDDLLNEYMAADMQFHVAIAQASKNELLLQSMVVVKDYCYQALEGFVTPSIREKSREYHQKIFECVQNHEPGEAANFMHAHLTDVYMQIELDMKNS